MAKIKVTHYTVRGSGQFPADMLRYDQSWPERDSDAVLLTRSDAIRLVDGPREVRLVTHGVITPQRWLSFGWQVIEQRESSF